MVNSPNGRSALGNVSPRITSGQGAASNGAACLCLWNLGFMTVGDMHKLLRSILESENLYVRIIRISRVVQSKDGHIRFDIFVTNRFSLVVKNCLVRVLCNTNSWNALIREHIPYAERKARSFVCRSETNLSNRRIQPRIVSLNVNSLLRSCDSSSSKHARLIELLATLDVDVCLLQETMRAEESLLHRLFIADYGVIEQPARSHEQHGARGLAIIHKISFPLHNLNSVSNDFCVGAEFRVPSLTIRFASIYLCKHSMRQRRRTKYHR